MNTDNCPCRLLKILVLLGSAQISNGIHNSYLHYMTISCQKLEVWIKELSQLITAITSSSDSRQQHQKNLLKCSSVCVCLRPFTLKASSVWISWNATEQINDVVLNTFLFSAKSLHRYYSMEHQSFLTSHFILFTHQKRVEPRLNYCASRFQNIRSSFTIIRHRPCSALHRKSSYLWLQALTRGVAI